MQPTCESLSRGFRIVYIIMAVLITQIDDFWVEICVEIFAHAYSVYNQVGYSEPGRGGWSSWSYFMHFRLYIITATDSFGGLNPKNSPKYAHDIEYIHRTWSVRR